MILSLLFVVATNAHAGELISLKDWKAQAARCDGALTEPDRLVPVHGAQARRLFLGVLDEVRRTDAVMVSMRVDMTGAIWDWTPRDERVFLDLRFERDDHHRAKRVFVTRHRDSIDLIIQDPYFINTLEDLLRQHRENAEVFIDLELEALFAREPLTRGLVL